jgi:two-component system OmpR family sensor kinase
VAAIHDAAEKPAAARANVTVAPWRRRGNAGGWRPLVSARSRILGWSVLLLAAAMAAFTVATHESLVRSMNSRITAELEHEMAEFRSLAARSSTAARHEEKAATAPSRSAALTLLQARSRSAALEPGSVLLGVINGKIVATSRNFHPGLDPAPAVLARWSALRHEATGSVRMGTAAARYTALPVRVSGRSARVAFVAAVLTGPGQASIDNLTRLQIEVGTIALLAGSLLAWLVAGRVLRPVRATTELARRITETDLSERIPGRGRDEVSDLAVTFNGMLDRLEGAMTTQRRFLADAGHELRTPITVIQGNLDTLAASSPEDAETLAIVADEIARMNRLVDELLLLAGSERPDFLRPEPTDVAQLTRSLLAKARALDDRPWRLTGYAEGTADLDPQRITQAVMQLAANAAAHTPAGAPVEISSAMTGGLIEFAVADHGPGIPLADRGRVFGRFARLDQRRTDGSGLGLAIVAAIVAAHGGSVHICDRDDGTPGAVFRLTIPRNRAAAGPPAGSQPRTAP